MYSFLLKVIRPPFHTGALARARCRSLCRGSLLCTSSRSGVRLRAQGRCVFDSAGRRSNSLAQALVAADLQVSFWSWSTLLIDRGFPAGAACNRRPKLALLCGSSARPTLGALALCPAVSSSHRAKPRALGRRFLVS